MTDNTIFETTSIHRSPLNFWEERLAVRTPWENHKGIWFKREDHFAPLGYGGPNGSKMRQLIWYFDTYRGNATHVVTGASIQSPQLSMSAIVASHYGMGITQVVYSKPETILKHDNPRISAGFGARFDYVKGPYNPIIQARVRELSSSSPHAIDDPFVVHYGIGLPQDEGFGPEDWLGFHSVGARQVENMPPDVHTLIVPAGSCNSLASIFLGLSRNPGELRQLITMGIGPNKMPWLHERLRAMGVDVKSMPFDWVHYSLHDSGYSSYSDKFKGESWDGINFHPTYEAKIWRWFREQAPIRQDDSVGFWIVGAEGRPSVIEPFYTHPEAVA